MPGSWDYRRRVRKPASLHLVGFLLSSGISPKVADSGALLFNGGQYNRSVLISAIRVARAGSRFSATPRLHARSRVGSRFWSNHRTPRTVMQGPPRQHQRVALGRRLPHCRHRRLNRGTGAV